MISRPPAQCEFCRHFESPLDTGKDKPTCSAFPAAIPDDIWWNRADHRNPYPGDHGIRWEPDEGAEFPEYAMNPERS